MGDAFPSAILDSILKQLESPIFHRNKLRCGLGIQLRDIRSKLELFRAVIYDAELMGIMFPQFVRKCLCKLQCILHDLDDLLDEGLTRSTMPESSMVEKVCLHLHNLPFRLTSPRKMKDIDGRLEGIVKEFCKCNLFVVERGLSQLSDIGGGSETPIPRTGILRCHPNYVKEDEFQIIGRDDDKKAVIKMLFDEDPDRAVVRIVGNVGAGKTALCRAVYNDEKVSKHFEVRVWVGLEDVKGYSSMHVWKKIITTLDEARSHPDTEEEEEDNLLAKIISLVGARNVLLVLDCFPPLSYFQSPFTYDFWARLGKLNDAIQGGIKTLLTSTASDFEISRYSESDHKLRNDLSEEHSWSIFKNIALVPDLDREEWIEYLGKKIVSRCPGNPALLRGVGTLLHGKESEDDRCTWEYFARDFDFEGQYRHYVSVSSMHYLFQIFRQPVGYLALFLQHEFKYEALMDQLAASGFNGLSDEMQQRFKDEFLRLVKEKDDWDDVGDYKIVDHLHGDITQVGADSTILRWKENDLPNGARHVAISRPSSNTNQPQENMVLTDSSIKDVIHKRSLLFLGKWHPVIMSVQTLDTLASNLLYLRVLDLHDLALKELPSSIGKLIHLRYLDLSRNDFKELPDSVCRLKNLLTLRLIYCDKLIKLPRGIKNLLCLKHLEINMCLDLTHMPSEIAKLTCLQRLDRFVVGPHQGGLRYLEHLDSLNGHLTIELPQQWEKSPTKDAEMACLQRKGGITTLEFKWQGTYSGKEDTGSYNDVLEKLKSCTSIENLFIVNFGGTKFPSWIIMGNCLTRITISHCRRCEILPPFHGFPELKYLTLTSMMDIEYLQDNFSGGDALSAVPSVVNHVFFPSLRELRIGCMPKLKGWSANVGGLPRSIKVEIAEIWKCPLFTVTPPFESSGTGRIEVIILQDISEKMLQSINWGEHDNVQIISIQDMVSLPNNVIANFPRHLKVEGCNKWQKFWANGFGRTQTQESLSSGFEHLRYLSIRNCREMKHMSSGLRRLIGLRSLEICRCSEELDCLYDAEDDGMPWKALKRLGVLKIEGFGNLESIPKGL